jgi:hypothetical protein
VFFHKSNRRNTRPYFISTQRDICRTRTTRRALLGRTYSWTQQDGTDQPHFKFFLLFKSTLACSIWIPRVQPIRASSELFGHRKYLSSRQQFSLFVPFSFLRLTSPSAHQHGVLFCGQDIRVPLCQLAIVGCQLEHERKVVLAPGRSLISDGHR